MPFLKGRGILESRCRNLENLAMKNGLRHAIFSPSSDKYVGEWKDNIKEGKGYLLSRSGRLYEGDWERGYRHGFGVFAVKNKNSIFNLQYRGGWKNGRMDGFGQYYCNGNYYLGNWKNGKKHGYGQMWYADGGFYDGNWTKDLRHGLGMYVRPDGNRYEGSWSQDKKNGKGRFFHLNSGQMQEGIWNKDVCIYSCIVDTPFRQTAVEPTPYPIRPIEIQDHEQFCTDHERKALQGKLHSCTSLRIWV